MRLSELLLLPAVLTASVLAGAESSSSDYSEHLHLKPLPPGYLYAGFNFTATTSRAEYDNQHFRYFPRSLGQILQHTHTNELHLRFAAGRWDDETWGSRPRNGSREGGTGVELWAWIDRSGSEETLRQRWSSLVNSLSGLFCASLNFIDDTKTTKPATTFDREGTTAGKAQDLQLLHGVLPHEVVCTENLTPLLKLLPCKGKVGISSLLDGHKVFDANWQTMSVDVRPLHERGEAVEKLEVQLTVDMVLDIERAMRPRDDPIPRPRPIEEIECDVTKSYHGHDTCYPRRTDDEMAWSLSRIFGQPVKGSCQLGSDGTSSDITLEVHSSRNFEVLTSGLSEHTKDEQTTRFVLPKEEDFDLSLPRQSLAADERVHVPAPVLYASRQITGYGQERGGIHATLRNPQPFAQRVVYLESLPWFLRPYVHTLKVKGAELQKMYYIPAIDRERGTQLELLLEIPPYTTVDLTYDFEKAILRYTEYPPDANRGFDIAAAVVRVLPPTSEQGSAQGHYLRTTSLLLPLPTPDFSMPYNVIILTSTVIALGFGSIFNLLVRRFVLAEEVPASPLAEKLAKVRELIREKLGKVGKKVAGTEGAAAASTSDSVGKDVKGTLNGGARAPGKSKAS